jgi:hypothetical protein
MLQFTSSSARIVKKLACSEKTVVEWYWYCISSINRVFTVDYVYRLLISDENDDSTSIGAMHLAASLPVSDEMMSSTCSDSVALELTTSTSDGLSDKENVVRLLKNQMKFSSARLSVGVSD